MTGLDLITDVLVVGGGPAATWAALKSAQAGAEVVLADKGYCGTSGATASAGTGVWYVPPDPAAREAAMASREKLGGYLDDRRWKRAGPDVRGHERAGRAGPVPLPHRAGRNTAQKRRARARVHAPDVHPRTASASPRRHIPCPPTTPSSATRTVLTRPVCSAATAAASAGGEAAPGARLAVGPPRNPPGSKETFLPINS
ncbi:FAD-binding protein [Streptomyces platensis]|uniref:FAD-dependent oxidoreductase n=1 Tax=Streptomyces platensis TaxID=58346 RepID=UPI002ED5838B|nr:FAD-binding protein [Streptomyces platensis]